jgi:hypothetical protein
MSSHCDLLYRVRGCRTAASNGAWRRRQESRPPSFYSPGYAAEARFFVAQPKDEFHAGDHVLLWRNAGQ